MAGRRPLRGARAGSNNVFTVGNGHHLGLAPGTWEEPGDRSPRAGTWPRRAARGVGRPASWPAWRGEAGQGPSISYMEGPCLILPGRSVCARGRPAGNAGPAATTWGHDRARARSPGDRRAGGRERRSGRAGSRPVQDRRSASLQDRVPRRRTCSVCPAGSDGQKSRRARCSNDSSAGKATSGDRGSCGHPPGRAPG
jgi:hypothetical protein